MNSAETRTFRRQMSGLPIRILWNVMAVLERDIHSAMLHGEPAARIRYLRHQREVAGDVLVGRMQNRHGMAG